MRCSLAELGRHSTPEDGWMALYDRVYDVTAFLARHPGGRATGSLLLPPGGSAGSEQLAADPGRQEGAEVVALRREVAALREKIGRLESVLEGQL